MRLAVVGSRTYPVTAEAFSKLTEKRQRVELQRGLERVSVELLSRLQPGDVVVSGGAKGPDTWGAKVAKARKCTVEVYEPDWNKGKGAGFARNTTIVEKADEVLAFWDGKSRGTLDTIKKAHAKGKPVTVIMPDGTVRSNREKLAA